MQKNGEIRAKIGVDTADILILWPSAKIKMKVQNVVLENLHPAVVLRLMPLRGRVLRLETGGVSNQETSRDVNEPRFGLASPDQFLQKFAIFSEKKNHQNFRIFLHNSLISGNCQEFPAIPGKFREICGKK